MSPTENEGHMYFNSLPDSFGPPKKYCWLFCTSKGCWVLQHHIPVERSSRGWWSHCCRTEPSPSLEHSTTWVLYRRIWSATTAKHIAAMIIQKDNTNLTYCSTNLFFPLTMVLQRGSPSGSVSVPPYTTGSCSGSMCVRNTSCQLPIKKEWGKQSGAVMSV